MNYYACIKPAIIAEAESFATLEEAQARARVIRGFVLDGEGVILHEYTFVPPPNGYFNFMR